MSLPAPPYTVTQIDGEPERDQHGNWSAFVSLNTGDSALLRMKGPFPVVGDQITDRVLEEVTSKAGNQYLKLVKPQRVGGSRSPSGTDGPGEAYWAGQNAAKGRAHAQEMAIRAHAAGWRTSANQDGPNVVALVPLIDFFQRDAEQARDRATAEAERGSASGAVQPPGGANGDRRQAQAPSEPSGVATSSSDSPTQAQVQLMLKMARERGIDGPGMKALLRSKLGVEQFSQLRKNDCVDRWRAALAFEAGDLPADPWPADDPSPVQDPDDDDIPF